MSDQQVMWALRALQGLKASKVMSVLQDLRVQQVPLVRPDQKVQHQRYLDQPEQPVQKDLQVLKEFKG